MSLLVKRVGNSTEFSILLSFQIQRKIRPEIFPAKFITVYTMNEIFQDDSYNDLVLNSKNVGSYNSLKTQPFITCFKVQYESTDKHENTRNSKFLPS